MVETKEKLQYPISTRVTSSMREQLRDSFPKNELSKLTRQFYQTLLDQAKQKETKQ